MIVDVAAGAAAYAATVAGAATVAYAAGALAVGYVFWGLFPVLGAIVVGYWLWLRRVERGGAADVPARRPEDGPP